MSKDQGCGDKKCHHCYPTCRHCGEQFTRDVGITPFAHLCPECRGKKRLQLAQEAYRTCKVGKKTQSAVYIHASSLYLTQISDYLLCLVRVAAQIRGGSIRKDWDVVKISRDGSSVSFLSYPGFFQIRNPILVKSVHVNIDKERVTTRHYGSSRNPPVLHRKEEMLIPDHPEYGRIAKETAEDEELGLLGRNGIGNLQGWVKAQQEVASA